MNCPYNVYYDNRTGRVVIQKNNNIPVIRSRSPLKEFDKKIEELYKFTNIKSPNNVNIEKANNYNSSSNNTDNANNYKMDIESINKKLEDEYKKNYDNIKNEDILKKNMVINNNSGSSLNINNNTNYNSNNNNQFKKQPDNLNLENNIRIEKDKNIDIDKSYSKSLIYGIKKTILSDFNHLYQSSNINDFRIGINKNCGYNNKIFDCFYLFPNISEINSKNETNIINEKKIEIFSNKFNPNDIQYFPIDFVACGINIPLKTNNQYFTKLKIKNIFWNIFQSINCINYNSNEILAIIPNQNDFIYKNINLQVNFELHSQIVDDQLPYKNNNIKSITPANSCLYNIPFIEIPSLNGSNFNFLEINLNTNFKLECALLCIKISVPDNMINKLEGFDKYNKLIYGNIPFSQFILNFDYELF